VTKLPSRPRIVTGSLILLLLIAGLTLGAAVKKRPTLFVPNKTAFPQLPKSITSKPATTETKPVSAPVLTRPEVRLLAQSANTFRFEFRYPEPTIETKNGKSSVNITGISQNRLESGYFLPTDIHPFVWTLGVPNVRIIEIESARQTTPSLLKTSLTVNDSVVMRAPTDRAGFQPAQFVVSNHIGSYRGVPLAALTIYPVRYDAKNTEIQYIKRIVVEVTGKPGASGSATGRQATTSELEHLRQISGTLAVTIPSSLHTTLHTSPMVSTVGNVSHVRIDVTKLGVYRVTGAQLARLGVPIQSIDPHLLNLVSEGQQIPIHVEGDENGTFGPDAVIEFFGRPPMPEDTVNAPDLTGNRYTKYKAYLLSWNDVPGMRVPEISGQIRSTSTNAFYTVNSGPLRLHFEQDAYFASLAEVSDEMRDRWFWDAGIYKYEIRNYPFFLPYPDTGNYSPIVIRAALHSLTGGGVKHHAFVLLNGSSDHALEIGRSGTGPGTDWGGQDLRIVESSSSSNINNTYLRHGYDSLAIFSPGDTQDSVSTNRIALNWFEVTYQRLPVAYNDEVRIGTPSNIRTDSTLFDYTLTNFTSPDIQVYRWGSADIINGTVERYVGAHNSLRYSIHFQDEPGVPTEYYAITGAKKISVPDSMLAFIAPDSLLNPPGGGAEYLVIGPSYLLQTPQLSQILTIRGQQFHGAMAIDVEKIFARYSQGMFEPSAIRSFLQYAVANWTIPPTTVMLLGDAQFNQQFAPRTGGSIIPHPMMPVSLVGAVGTDTWYALLDNDFIPDLNISRVSARTVSEAGDYFDKVLEVENMPRQERWQNTITFLRGNINPGSDTYPTIYDLNDLSNQQLLGPNYDINNLQVAISSAPAYGGPTGLATQNLVTLFTRGTSLMIYNGHGGGDIWADNGLFRLPYINSFLTNQGKYPLICNFSCFIVTFNLVDQRTTMGEEFLFAQHKGGIGVFGSTGLGLLEPGISFQNYMFEDFVAHPGITYGELLSDSKALYAISNDGVISTATGNTYWATSLLGDPGVRFPIFNDVQQTISQSLVQAGDQVTINATLPFSSGTASFRWYRDNETSSDNPPFYPVDTTFVVTSNQFSETMTVPSNFVTPVATIRGFYQTSTGQATRGFSVVYLRNYLNGSTMLDSLITDPAKLFADTTYRLAAKVVDPNTVASLKMYLRWMENNNDSNVTIALDTVSCTPSPTRGQYWFESPDLHSMGDLRTLYVKVHWVNDSSRSATSDSFAFQAVVQKPNVVWYQPFFQWNTSDTLEASYHLYNNGNISCGGSRARLAIVQGADTIATVFQNVPPIAANQYATVNFPFPNPPGLYTLVVDADFDNVINESDETDNREYFQIQNNNYWITSSSGTGSGTYTPSPNIRITIPPASLNRPSAVFQISEVDTFSTLGQAGLHFATYAGNVTNGRGFIMTCPDSSVHLSRVIVEMTADSIVGNRIRVHGRSHNGLWKILNSSTDTTGVNRYDGPAYESFALIDNQDRTPPTFHFAAEGQIFSEGGYVRHGAKFSAMAFDDGGLDLSATGAVIGVVDGDTLAPNEMSLPSTLSTSKTQSVTINHQFTAGRHNAVLWISDLVGNRANDSINFVVVNDFRLDWVGNFPNPFPKTTTFFYNLTDQTTEPVEIMIYTVSGRKIRTLHETESKVINYRELTWDGRDEEGQIVANGVYFYRFIAKNGQKTIEHKGKLAKLR